MRERGRSISPTRKGQVHEKISSQIAPSHQPTHSPIGGVESTPKTGVGIRSRPKSCPVRALRTNTPSKASYVLHVGEMPFGIYLQSNCVALECERGLRSVGCVHFSVTRGMDMRPPNCLLPSQTSSNWPYGAFPMSVEVSTLQTSPVMGTAECAALLAPVWEGRQGGGAASVRRGTTVPLSPTTNTVVVQWLGTTDVDNVLPKTQTSAYTPNQQPAYFLSLYRKPPPNTPHQNKTR